ncbi:hypothetical protein [Microbacterium sp.]
MTTIRFTFENATRQEAVDAAQELAAVAETLTGEAPWWAVETDQEAER